MAHSSQVAHMLRTRREADESPGSMRRSPSHHGVHRSPSQRSPSHQGHLGDAGDHKGHTSHHGASESHASHPNTSHSQKRHSQRKRSVDPPREKDDDQAGNDVKNDAVCLTGDGVIRKSLNGPIIDLRGREVLFAISVFFFFSLCVGLVVVVATNQAKLLGHERLMAECRKDILLARNGDVCTTAECVTLAARLLNIMNQSADPCEDFWEYSCGGWLDQSIIPPERERWGIDSELKDKILKSVKSSLEAPVSRDSPRSAERKAKVMYSACLDTDSIDSLGLQPFNDVIDKYGGWAVHDSFNIAEKNGRWSFQDMLADLHFTHRANALFVIYVQPDEAKSDTNIIMFDQNGLGIDSHWYLSDETSHVTEAYMTYLRQSAVAAGATQDNAERFARDTFQFEKELAKLHIPEEVMATTDPRELYHSLNISQLQETAPRIDWLKLLRHTFDHVTESTKVATTSGDYLAGVSRLLQRTGDRILNYYLVWRLIQAYGEALPQSLRQAQLQFKHISKGTSGRQPRWEHCVDMTSEWLGMAVGAMYVNQNLPDEDRQQVAAMSIHLRNAFMSSISNSSWMSDTTKVEAKRKLKLMTRDIGYPDFLTNWTAVDAIYSQMSVPDGEGYFRLAVQRASNEVLLMKRHLEGTPHNTKQWDVNPHVPNAFYSPTENKIVFPAGLLQPPYYVHNAPRYINYGGIGCTIAHEMVHGFDNYGSAFDAHGNERLWLSQDSWSRFQQDSMCLVNHYSNYTEGGNKIDGELTLNENLADVVGLRIAYNAYMHDPGDEKVLPGLSLSGHQAFFLAFAQNWCVKRRPQNMADKVATSSHAPERVRVMGTLTQTPQFAEAFGCPRLPPNKQCHVW